MGYHVAVVGATGAVGREMLDVLARRGFPVSRLTALASPRSAGAQLPFAGGTVTVEPLSDQSFEGVDVALFSAGSSISKSHAPRAVAAGALVVDNSSAFRMDPDVPLVVPEINPDAGRITRGIIANPNCTTIITLLAVAPLHRAIGVERFTAASYQAASGAGARAMAEVLQQARAWVANEPLQVEVFPHALLWNCFPHIDVFLDQGYTREEMKMVHETRKILADPSIRCSATCVRIPVLRAHSVAVHVELRRAVSPDEARSILAKAPGVRIDDDPSAKRYPMPKDVAGRDDVFVGRIRKDVSHERGLAMWVVGDQLLKGAALNAVQCAELALGIGPYARSVA